MKSAEQWQQELAGETSLESYRAVQADALRHAAVFAEKCKDLHDLKVHRHAIDTVKRAITAEADKLEGMR